MGTYDKMLDLEEDAVSRVQLLHSSAAVAREELKDYVAARRYLEEAIQIDPLCLRCGDELSSLLRNWKIMKVYTHLLRPGLIPSQSKVGMTRWSRI